MSILRLWAVVAVSGLSALACVQPSQPAQPGEQIGEPKHGGVLNVTVTTDPYDWDPSYGGKSNPNGGGIDLSYNSLLSYKMGPDVGYHEAIVIPKLADRWDVSPDAKTFTFHLSSGIRFANLPPVNGRELTAADAKWSLEYWSRSGAFADKKLPVGQYQWMFEGLDRIDAVDSQTVTVRFKTPSVPFVRYAAADMLPIVPKEIYEAEGHLKNTMVGSGPYQLDRSASQPGVRWVWQKNQTYWEAGKPYLDSVRWLVIPDDSTFQAAFKSGQVDIHPMVSFNIGQEVQKANPNAVAHETPGLKGDFWLRVDRPPLNDVRVRRAIALSIDRDELMRVLQGGRGIWQMPHLLTPYFSQEEIKQLQPYNPTEAKRLLAEAGHANGVDLELPLPAGKCGAECISEIELLQSQLKKGGINLVLKTVEAAQWSINLRAGNFWVIVPGGSDAKWDVSSTLYKYHPASATNYAGTNDPRLTSLIDAQMGETDETKRREIVRQAGRIIAEQAYGIVMYTPVRYEFWQPYVKNYAPNWNVFGWPLKDTWLDK